MEKAIRAILKTLVLLLWAIVLLSPLLLPRISNESIMNTLPTASFFFFYGVPLGMLLSLRLHRLPEKQRGARKRLLWIFPVWGIPLFIATMTCLWQILMWIL